VDKIFKIKPPKGGKTKKVAGKAEDPDIVGIPDTVRIVVIAVEPQAIIVVFHVEHVQIAIRVENV
jgi:hypothetical protein